MPEYNDIVIAMLDLCEYPEDARAMRHFVFHPRLNGCSNLCLLCGMHAAIDPEDKDDMWETGHSEKCRYAETVRRVRGSGETLSAYVDRQ